MSNQNIGIGLTEELSLRVSVGVLVKVILTNHVNEKTMLALERTATLRTIENKSVVEVKVKPFGGAVRLLKPDGLKKLIGDFNFDSERSREEGDFRIQINPEQWEKVKEICKEHLKEEKGILDPSPVRELAEEFEDSLKVSITPDDYNLQPGGMILEDASSDTDNVNARGRPTVRVYYLFDALLKNTKVIKLMIDNSNLYSDIDLQKKANADFRNGGKGRANAILLVDLNELKDFYNSIPMDKRKGSIEYDGHQLDGNIPAFLKDITYPKYQQYQ